VKITEASIIKREIRGLKSTLNTRQKQTAREIKKRRDLIRSTEREITTIEREQASFVKATTDRLAIIDGRINS
jgi:hypothetical protein